MAKSERARVSGTENERDFLRGESAEVTDWNAFPPQKGTMSGG